MEAVTNEMFRCSAKQGEYFARMTNYKGYDEQLEEVTYTNYLHKEGQVYHLQSFQSMVKR